METLLAPAINLGLLLAVLAYFLRTPLKSFVADRGGSIRQQLEEARSQLSLAKARFEDCDARLRGLAAEVQALSSQATEESKRMKARMVQSAERAAAGLLSDAQAAAGGLRDEAVSQLRVELATRAVARAEEQIRARLTGEERARLRKEFSVLVEKSR